MQATCLQRRLAATTASNTPSARPPAIRAFCVSIYTFLGGGASKARIASKLNTKLDVLHIARIAHNELRGRPTYAKEVQKTKILLTKLKC